MKKILVSFIAFSAVAALMLTGCAEEKKTAKKSSAASSSATTAATTEQATSKATEKATKAQKETQPTKATEKETTAPPETQAPAINYEKLLTSKKWICEKCVKDGKTLNIQDYYGSIVKESGAYIQFKTDNTFKCVMGNEGCEGTYKLSGDRLTVTKTIIYTGAKEKQTSDTEKLTVEDDFASITMTLNGVKITFV